MSILSSIRKSIPSGQSIKISYLITLTHLKRNWRLFGGGILFLIMLGLAQWKFTLINFTENSVSEGLVGTYQQHDLPTEVMRLVSKSLVESDINGRIQPQLVSHWSVNDGVTDYKFTLKPNMYWTDGSKIKASDIDFVIPNADVSFPDDQTIEFKLKEPYSAFPSLLTKPVIKKDTLIGVGPYKITKLEKSKVFITKLILSSTNNDLPNVIVRFYPTEKTALTGFALGEVQSLLGVNVPTPRLRFEELRSLRPDEWNGY